MMNVDEDEDEDWTAYVLREALDGDSHGDSHGDRHGDTLAADVAASGEESHTSASAIARREAWVGGYFYGDGHPVIPHEGDHFELMNTTDKVFTDWVKDICRIPRDQYIGRYLKNPTGKDGVGGGKYFKIPLNGEKGKIHLTQQLDKLTDSKKYYWVVKEADIPDFGLMEPPTKQSAKRQRLEHNGGLPAPTAAAQASAAAVAVAVAEGPPLLENGMNDAR